MQRPTGLNSILHANHEFVRNEGQSPQNALPNRPATNDLFIIQSLTPPWLHFSTESIRISYLLA